MEREKHSKYISDLTTGRTLLAKTALVYTQVYFGGGLPTCYSYTKILYLGTYNKILCPVLCEKRDLFVMLRRD